jgi:hypothetical protein
MIFAPFHPLRQDTILTPQQPDTVASPVIPPKPDQSIAGDSTAGFIPSTEILLSKPSLTSIKISSKEAVSVTLPAERVKKPNPEKWNSGGNFFIDNGLTGIVTGVKTQHSETSSSLVGGTVKPPEINPEKRDLHTYNWLLGVFLLLVLLFVWIRIFYSKFFAMLASALVSFQFSSRLFQEKNVMLHRVSLVLNFIYLIVLTVFLFEIIDYTGFTRVGMTGFRLFLLLFNIVILYALFRIFFLQLTGELFLIKPLFSEYIHNTFVINKGLGIALFPVVILAQYLPYVLIPVVLIAGCIIFSVAVLLKAFRTYQIIIRRDILLFYLILYLCTLEILPLLLGYKFVTSLIQSN